MTEEHRRSVRRVPRRRHRIFRQYVRRKAEVAEQRFTPENIQRRNVLVSDAIDDFLEQIQHTHRDYKNYVRRARFWKEVLGNRTLREILPSDIERAKARLLRKSKPGTVNRKLALLKTVFNRAIADGLLERSPFATVKMLRENNARTRFLSYEEEARIRTELGEDHWPLVEFALNTGLRRAEQFGLRWQDIDLANRVVTIRVSKSGKARTVPLNAQACRILRELPSRCHSDWMFPNQIETGPMDGHHFVGRVPNKARDRAAVRNFRWHDLRHTFASRLIMAGVDRSTVQDFLGHASGQMTERYTHLSRGHKRDAIEKIATKTGRATGTKTGTSGFAE